MVRKHYQSQHRFDCSPVAQVELNLECRDEIVPILAGLQFLYTNNKLRHKAVKLVAADLNEDSRRDVGRPGMDDWHVVVLAAVRLGCNFDYDKLQDQVENHRSLRGIMGIGDWQDADEFTYRRIRDTLCKIKPETLEKLNQVVVAAGHEIVPEAATSVRADSFVVETNIHYPTESSLIFDGVRKFVPLCADLAGAYDIEGWRQYDHLIRKIKKLKQNIGRIGASKSSIKKDALESLYGDLLARTEQLLSRADELVENVETRARSVSIVAQIAAIKRWIELTRQVCGTAHRRVLLGESVPNSEKLFSLFETHTQLYRRGKAGQPNQYGRLVLVFEDGAGFISHYHLMDRDSKDQDVVVEQTMAAQRKHSGQIETASFDRGFHSDENESALQEIVDDVCVLPRAPLQYAERLKNASVKFHQTRLRHSGVESAIGALQRGNGLKRCRDRSEIGFERYFGLAILGRNIHTLGKLLLTKKNASSDSAQSRRQAA
ncbi:ISNCY family transposase [Stieleria sp. TO1_6]|uniref:ISNCY family transposase n=1 Tax=Stieleria tagensis TaxID=2956795 RepID=UPI00209B8238|nr:ISNCY family transposase [Stieleria tagensis]MCO8120352.1 ISNCY family transposase [Stieleria tagensis]